mmetsp:Transcript_7528/g.9355  ORF Transcript_7528/g.9355 Transcript_7528/m.9355 type:complete len:210 (-) Transcript_7528:710-1339(-)
MRACGHGSSRNYLARLFELGAKVIDGLLESLFHAYLGVPSDLSLGDRNIRLALLRIVLRRRKLHDGRVRLDLLLDDARKLSDCVLIWIPEIYRPVVLPVHEFHEPIHEVVHELKRAGLLALAVDRDWFTLECLNDEVAHDSTIVWMHSRSEGVEDPSNPDVDVLLFLVRVHHRLSHALPFVIARPWTNRVHISPVRLGLRVNLWVSIDL